MHTIVTRIGSDCRNRRAPGRRLANGIRTGTDHRRRVDRLLSAAEAVLTAERDETLARMDEQIQPTHPSVIQTDRSGPPRIIRQTKCTHFNFSFN